MLLHLLNPLAKCDLSRTRTNREPSLRSGRHLSSHVSTDSCFAFSVRHFLHCILRTVQVLGTVGSSSTLVCSCTKFTANVVLMSTPTCHADVTMRRDICFLTKGNVCSCWYSFGIQLCRCCFSWCGVLSRLVLRIFCVVWVASPTLGIFSFPIDLNCKPLLECSCFIPGDVENAATAFSLTTRDIVEPIHLDATPYIGAHSSLDEAVPRWAVAMLALKIRT